MFIDSTIFVGTIKLVIKSYNEETLTSVISEIEVDTLKDLLGDELFAEFMDDLDGAVPETQKFKDLLDGTTYQDNKGFVQIHTGLTDMLAYFTYCEYVRVTDALHSSLGFEEPDSENAQKAMTAKVNAMVANAHNKGIVEYKSAEKYIERMNEINGATYYNNWESEDRSEINVLGL